MGISSFRFPTDIRFGLGASELLPQELKRLGKKRPLVITDRGLKEKKIVQNILQQLQNFQYNLFAETGGNPLESHVKAGVLAYKETGSDSIVALGGGCAIDVGKAVALLATHPGNLFDYEDGKKDARPIDGIIPFLLAIPTTAGTGSEVGGSTVISSDSDHKKYIIWGTKLVPSLVLCDPYLTLDLPPHLTAQTGIDALTHNIEAYLAKNFHPICDAIALEGVRLVSTHLKNAVHSPHDLEARSGMLMASLLGAIAFQKGLGVTHSMAHALSTKYDLHHGLANALCLDVAMQFNAAHCPWHFSRLMEAAKQEKDETRADKGFCLWLQKLLKDIGINVTLKDLRVKLDDNLIQIAYNDPCHQNNPRPCALSDIKDLFTSAIGA